MQTGGLKPMCCQMFQTSTFQMVKDQNQLS